MPSSDYTPQTWHDEPTEDTPVSAERLTVIEEGIRDHVHGDVNDAIATLQTDVDALQSSSFIIAEANSGYITIDFPLDSNRYGQAAIPMLPLLQSPGGVACNSIVLSLPAATYPALNLAVVVSVTDATGANSAFLSDLFGSVTAGVHGPQQFAVDFDAHPPEIVGTDLTVADSTTIVSAAGGLFFGAIQIATSLA